MVLAIAVQFLRKTIWEDIYTLWVIMKRLPDIAELIPPDENYSLCTLFLFAGIAGIYSLLTGIGQPAQTGEYELLRSHRLFSEDVV